MVKNNVLITGPTNTGEQASQDKMFTLIKSIVVSRISSIFTGKNKRFWEFPTGRQVEVVKKRVYYLGNG